MSASKFWNARVTRDGYIALGETEFASADLALRRASSPLVDGGQRYIIETDGPRIVAIRPIFPASLGQPSDLLARETTAEVARA